MGKYNLLQTDIFSIFDSAGWIAETIPTFPSDFVKTSNVSEWLRVEILPNGVGINPLSASGVVIIDIYTPSGKGPKRSSAIADKLDTHLANKSVITGKNSTQFGASVLRYIGEDPVNKALSRYSYTITFNYFGAT